MKKLLAAFALIFLFTGNAFSAAVYNPFADSLDFVGSTTVSGTISVSDTAYDESSWNGETTDAPSKNAVRDKFESLSSSDLTDDAFVLNTGDTITGDLTISGGDLVLTNGETISNDTDGEICLNGAGGSHNENLCFDLDYVSNYILVSSDTSLATLGISNFNIGMTDDRGLTMGSSADSKLFWETTGNDNLQIGTDVGSATASGYISLMEGADMGVANRSPSGTSDDPVLRVYSSDATSATDYIEFSHDQTDGLITSGIGDILMTAESAVHIYKDSPSANETLFQIGTSDDSSRFTVDEDGDVDMDGVFTAINSTDGNQIGRLIVDYDAASNPTVRGQNGNIRFDSAFTIYTSGIELSSVFSDDFQISHGRSNQDIIFEVSPGSDSNYTEAMVIDGTTAGIGIGTDSPSALLELSSTDDALLLTRLSDPASNVSVPVNGMIAYDSGSNEMQAYVNGAWVNLGASGGGSGATTDGGATTYLTSQTDDFAIGGTDNTAPFFFDESTGEFTATGTINGLSFVASGSGPGTEGTLTITNQLTIPLNKTTDADGEITHDDTSDQIRYGADNTVLSPIWHKTFHVDSPTAGKKIRMIGIPYGVTITSIGAYVDPADSSESVAIEAFEINSDGDSPVTISGTLTAANTETVDSSHSNAGIASGGGIEWLIGTVTGTVDTLNVYITGLIDAD